MRAWTNLQNMKELTHHIMKRGFQLSAYLLLLGCWAICRGALNIADLFRELSATALLATIVATTYIELHL